MAHVTAYFASRDYTKPAIDRRIAELLKRRVGVEALTTETLKDRLVCKLLSFSIKLLFLTLTFVNKNRYCLRIFFY